MPKWNEGVFLAFGLILGLLFGSFLVPFVLSALSSSPEIPSVTDCHEPKNNGNAPTASKTDNQPKNSSAIGSNPQPASGGESPCKPYDYEIANLKVQIALAANAGRLNNLTILIVGVGIIQSIVFALTLLGTLRAANAAKAAVDALPVVERGYLYPAIVDVDGLKTVLKEAERHWNGDSEKTDVRIGMIPEISFKIVNHGKTPGVLTDVWGGLYLASAGETAPTHLLVSDNVLGEKQETVNEFTAKLEGGMTSKQAGRISLKRDRLLFKGTIFFDDIWGTMCVTDFVFVWDWLGQRFTHKEMRVLIDP